MVNFNVIIIDIFFRIYKHNLIKNSIFMYLFSYNSLKTILKTFLIKNRIKNILYFIFMVFFLYNKCCLTDKRIKITERKFYEYF